MYYERNEVERLGGCLATANGIRVLKEMQIESRGSYGKVTSQQQHYTSLKKRKTLVQVNVTMAELVIIPYLSNVRPEYLSC